MLKWNDYNKQGLKKKKDEENSFFECQALWGAMLLSAKSIFILHSKNILYASARPCEYTNE